MGFPEKVPNVQRVFLVELLCHGDDFAGRCGARRFEPLSCPVLVLLSRCLFGVAFDGLVCYCEYPFIGVGAVYVRGLEA